MTDCPHVDAHVRTLCRPMRLALQGLGCLCLALGVAGVILPGLPGTVFLIVALWAFSKSSARLHLWLYDHPRFGAGLRAWHAHRAIPRAAKRLAVATMGVSFTGLLWLAGGPTPATMIAGAVMAGVGVWIVTRPDGSALVLAPEADPGR